jgi:hypothetical protein
MSAIILGLIESSSVRLKSLAQTFPGASKVDSSVKHIYRLLKGESLCIQALARFIVSILPLQQKWIVAIDRTNWMFGKSPINIFTLGIVFKGITIPILFLLLPKDGASNAEERIEILQKFLAIWPKENIKVILGDREFLCKELLAFCCDNNLPFIWRSKKNILARHVNGGNMNVERLIGETRAEMLIRATMIWQQHVQLTYYKSSEAHEALYLVHSIDINNSEILDLYRDRWSIEMLFKAQKDKWILCRRNQSN